MRSGATYMVSPLKSTPRPSAPPGHRSTVEPSKWPAAPVQRDTFPSAPKLLPSRSGWRDRGAVSTAPILVHLNGHTAERMAPLHHAPTRWGWEMRRLETPPTLRPPAGGIINQADAVPQHVPSGCLQQRPLTDGKSWFCTGSQFNPCSSGLNTL